MTCADPEEAGTGLIGSAAGVLVFLLLLLFAAHVLLGLYTISVVDAAAYDAAKAVAGADGGAGTQALAEAQLRRLLGPAGRRASLRWDVRPDAVTLSVRTPRPAVLPRSLLAPAGLADVERTVRLRVESVR